MFYGAGIYGATAYGSKLGGVSLVTLNINVFDVVHVTDVIFRWAFTAYTSAVDNVVIDEYIKMKETAHVNVFDNLTTPTDLVTGTEYFIYSPSNFGPFGEDAEG